MSERQRRPYGGQPGASLDAAFALKLLFGSQSRRASPNVSADA